MGQSGDFQLRDYQLSIREQCLNALGRSRVLLQLPTGGGKTVVFASVAEDFTVHGERVLVLAHRKELIDQAAAKLRAIADCPTGVIKSGVKPDYKAPIQVASVQSLASRMEFIAPPDLIIIDEAHHATAKTYRRILDAFPDAFQLGVTATPCRVDGTGFKDLFDVLVTGPTVSDLIDQGHLSPYRLFAAPSLMRTRGARRAGGDYRADDVAELNPVVELSGNLISNYMQHCPGKRCIVFAVNVEHSRAIAVRYNQAGIPAAHLDGESSPERRAATLAAFARGELLVLSNVGLFTEGFDLPALDAVQIARPTKSLGLWLQMLGRVLRPSPGKDCAVILDHTANWIDLGLPTADMGWSLDGVEIKERAKRPDGDYIGYPMTEPLPVEIVETEDHLQEVDVESHFDEQMRFAKAHNYSTNFIPDFTPKAIKEAVEMYYPGSVCRISGRLIAIDDRLSQNGPITDSRFTVLWKITRKPEQWKIEIRSHQPEKDMLFFIPDSELVGKKKGYAEERISRTVAAIQDYNSGRKLAEQIAINKGSLRQLSGVNITTVTNWVNDHAAELDEYAKAHGHRYRQNVGKDLSVINLPWVKGAA